MSNLPAPPPLRQVKKAREALKAQAFEILEEYKAAIKMAIASGKYEEGLKAYQWLLDHIPGEDGERVFESSHDKQVKGDDGPRGPVINIGFKLGGVKEPKVIEGKVVEPDE